MKFTITGSQGMIGARLSAYLLEQGHEVNCLTRETPVPDDCGHVIHCAGVTGDFLARPLDTINAHVCMIEEILGNLESLQTFQTERSSNQGNPYHYLLPEDKAE